MAYIGHQVADRFVSQPAVDQFSGDGSTTAFTLSFPVSSDQDILVSVDGVIQDTAAYAVSSGTTLTFTAAPSSNSGNNIFVNYLARTSATVAHPSTSALAATTGAFSDAVTAASTLGVTGVVTANAGVVVDNITIDGAEIDLSSGDLIMDVAGGIILDADDNGTVSFKDDGTRFGLIESSSSDMVVQSTVSDKDMIFKGSDGGSTITALTLDMSAAGNATFNGSVFSGGNVVVPNGNGIDFSATGDASGMASELLDDYEEGTWTPVLSTSSGTAATYGAQQIGKYVKIGDLVHIYFDIAINQVNNSNTTLVVGHPFNSVNNDALAVSFFSALAVSPVFVSFQCAGSQGFMAVGLTTAGTNITNGMGIFGNSTRIIASGTYRTA